jgi:hypothetical protein
MKKPGERLPDCQPDLRAVSHSLGEDFLRSPEVVTGIGQPIDFRAVPRPLFDLVEITVVRLEGVESFFVGPIVHVLRPAAVRVLDDDGFAVSNEKERPARIRSGTPTGSSYSP